MELLLRIAWVVSLALPVLGHSARHTLSEEMTVVTNASMPRQKTGDLIKHLLENSGYSPYARPVHNTDTAVHVQVEMRLHRVIELNTKEEFIKIISWFSIAWKDEFLRWDPSDYGGVKGFHLPSSEIWRPDFLVYNSVDENQASNQVLADTNAVVDYRGHVIWMTSALLVVSCQVNVALYPFDTQNCGIQLGSWTYTTLEVNTTCVSPKADASSFVTDGEWDLLDVPCVSNSEDFHMLGFTDITFHIIMKRKPLFYLYNLLFPCSLLCVIGVLVFMVPPESGEKSSLAVTLLLAMIVFLLIVMDNVPATSDVIPLISKFLVGVMTILSLITALCMLLMKFYYNGQRGERPSRWMRRLILHWLARVVLLGDKFCPDNKEESSHTTEAKSPKLDCEASRIYHANEKTYKPPQSELSNSTSTIAVLHSIAKQVEAMSSLMEKVLKDKAKAEGLQTEWTHISQVMDRVCLVVFTTLTLALALGIFVQAP